MSRRPSSHQERILIRGLNWLGDSVMSLPAVEMLRHANPDAFIAILVPRKLAEFWRPPLVDSVIVFDKDETLWQVAQKLRAGQFTLGVVLPLSLRSALELVVAGIPRRIGYDHRGRGFLLTEPIMKPTDALEMRKRPVHEVLRLAEGEAERVFPPVPPVSHHVYRNLHLVSTLGMEARPQAPRLCVSENDAAGALHSYGLCPDRPGSPLFGMCPGGEYGPSKRWPEERFIDTARRLRAQLGCRWILFGSEGDRLSCSRIADAIQDGCPEPFVWNLAGRTSVHDLIVLLKGCGMMLSNDTGPMHVAAAVGTPVIGLFGSTSPDLTGPGLPGERQHRILRSSAPCSPCFLKQCPIDMRCMESLDVTRVVQEALAIHERCRQKTSA
jgi:heptosyltransferase-2